VNTAVVGAGDNYICIIYFMVYHSHVFYCKNNTGNTLRDIFNTYIRVCGISIYIYIYIYIYSVYILIIYTKLYLVETKKGPE
jgi:hypothetical protein